MADSLWLWPTGVYCRRPGERVRVPGTATLDGICSTLAHLVCPGYLSSVRGGEPAPGDGPGRLWPAKRSPEDRPRG